VRTLTYVAHKPGWTLDRDHWESETRAAEDALSDALHEALRRRFVDRLARVVVSGDVKADVDAAGAVSVGGEVIGRLEGLRFTAGGDGDGDGGTDPRRRLQRSAGAKGLVSAVQERVAALLAADASAFDVDAATLRVTWGSEPVGRLVRGRDRLTPRAVALPGAFDGGVRAQLDEKLTDVITAWVARALPGTVALRAALDKGLDKAPLARAWAFALVTGLGVCARDVVQEQSGAPDDVARSTLRRYRVRLGFRDAFVEDAFKDKAIRARAALTSLWRQPDDAPPPPPPPGASSFLIGARPAGFVVACGFHVFDTGEASARAFRIDLVDDTAIALKGFAPPFSSPAVACEKLGCSHDALLPVLEFLGYRRNAAGLFGRGKR